MSAEPKQTDRDHLADLIHDAVNAGGDDLTFDVAYSIAGCIVGSEWLKEHVIAAEQAGREDNALHDMCYVSGSKALEALEAAARREALLEAAEEMQAEKTMPFWSVHVAALRKRAALADPERDEEGGRPVRVTPRLRACVERWPDCATGEYNPACCRFPKSCSATVYDPEFVKPGDLEEGGND